TTGPMIQSYTQDLGRVEIRDNSINISFTKLLQIEPTLTTGYASDTRIGPNHYQGTGERPIPCNRDLGLWVDWVDEIPSLGTPLAADGSYDPNFTMLSEVTLDPVDEAELTLGGSATRAAATDSLGGTNAREYTFTVDDGTDYVGIPTAGVAFTAGANYFIEFEIKVAATQSLTEVDLEAVMTMASGSKTVRRGVVPTADWMLIRLPMSTQAAMTGQTTRIYPSPDSFAGGSQDKIQIGRVRIYRANRPVNFSHNFIGLHSWSGGIDKREGPEASQNYSQWVDWTNSELHAKFGTPSSETDGSLIALMANAGAGTVWTPVLEGLSVAGAGTYTANTG
ncbi:unnamed protein product, partial [marine sediment metagenome]